MKRGCVANGRYASPAVARRAVGSLKSALRGDEQDTSLPGVRPGGSGVAIRDIPPCRLPEGASWPGRGSPYRIFRKTGTVQNVPARKLAFLSAREVFRLPPEFQAGRPCCGRHFSAKSPAWDAAAAQGRRRTPWGWAAGTRAGAAAQGRAAAGAPGSVAAPFGLQRASPGSDGPLMRRVRTGSRRTGGCGTGAGRVLLRKAGRRGGEAASGAAGRRAGAPGAANAAEWRGRGRR